MSRLLEKLQRLEDTVLLSPKIIYFVVCTAYYALYLFRAKFLTRYLALDSGEYGDISAIMALVSFAFMTLWGTFADALGRHRLILALLCVALAGVFELFLWVHTIEGHMMRFVLSATVMAIYSLFASGILPLTDYLTLRLLSNKPGFSKDMYGRQRLWGTISYGLTSLVVGWFVEHHDLVSLYYLLPISSAACVLTIFLLAPRDTPKPTREAISLLIPSRRRKASLEQLAEKEAAEKPPTPKDEKVAINDDSNNSVPQSLETSQEEPLKKKRSPFLQLLTNPNYMFMLFVVFMAGSARAVMTTFLGKYWQDSVKLNDTKVGLAANFGILMEIIIFFFGPLFLRFFGVYWMLIFSQTAAVLRCWAYVLMPAKADNFWIIYLIELLKGVAFGFTQVSGVKLASDAAPRGLEATAQALYTSVYSQLPAVITAFAGGRVYKRYGPQLLFVITASVSTAALVLFILKYLVDGSIRFPWNRRKAHTPTVTVIRQGASESN